MKIAAHQIAALIAIPLLAISLPQLLQQRSVQASESPATPALTNPDQPCRQCHQQIYDRYQRTSMARGSGLATQALIPGTYHQAAANVDFRVFLRDASAWMSYTRPATDPRGPLSGERRLDYYIGSGHRGRTYLFNDSGLWYELPINFYTRRNSWGMAPAFDDAAAMPAPLPVDPNCLHCHTSAVQPSLEDARNHFAAAPFHQGGIGCSACHGDPAAHLAGKGRGPILNPGKLNPARRDSACIQCHLEGDAVAYRPGRSLAQFTPGDDLSDIAVYFVRASESSPQPGNGARATSQYEALLRSACKRAAGDRLTCTTCHDPHFDPPSAERVQYFRQRCLSCHTNPAMASHHPDQPDCAHCHMPTRNTIDISHEQVTDHDIEAYPPAPVAHNASTNVELAPVGNFPASERDTGLAYAQFAQRGDPKTARAAAERALSLLSKLPPTTPVDVEVAVRLGYLEQISGDPASARAAYTAALTANPWEPTALANLAVLDAGSNRVPEAIHLLERLVNADPAQTAAGLNLAFIQCSLNKPAQARVLLDRLRKSNPDDPQLRQFLASGQYAGQRCSLTEPKPPTR